MSERSEWARRRNEALTYYPDVARVGNLADALTEAFAEIGASLTASSPFPLDDPVFSPFNDHPDALGMTVPEFASVSARGRVCRVSIAFFSFALGDYGLSFSSGEARGQEGSGQESDTIITGDLSTIIANDLATVALVIRRALKDGAELAQLAQASGATFEPPPRFRSNPAMEASVKRILANIRAKLASTDPQDQERVRRAGEALRKGLKRDGEEWGLRTQTPAASRQEWSRSSHLRSTHR